MSIKELQEKIKPFYSLLLAILSGGVFFTLGHFSGQNSPEKVPIKVEINEVASAEVSYQSSTSRSVTTKNSTSNSIPTPKTTDEVIGSKSGKKYYFPWCGTVKRIKLENQVHFATIELAKQAGFTPGGNCKGLK